MGFVLRWMILSVLMVGLGLVWWYPAPQVIRFQAVDWKARYARSLKPSPYFRPPKEQTGAPKGSPEAVRLFVEEELAGRSMAVEGPVWSDLEEHLLAARGVGEPVLFRDTEGFNLLDTAHRYLLIRNNGHISHVEYRRIPAGDFSLYPIPAAVAYPLRTFWPLLGGSLLILLAWGLLERRKAGPVACSSAGNGTVWMVSLLMFSAGLLSWPELYGLTGQASGYASMLVGLLFLLGSLAGLLLFGRQVRLLRDWMTGTALAHFTYDEAEWQQFAQWNYGRESEEKKGLWLFICGIALVVGVGFVLIMRDEASLWVLAVLAGLMAVLWLVAVGLPRSAYRRHMRGPGEVFIGPEGLCLNGTVHTWDVLGARLESVTSEQIPLRHLLVRYSWVMLAGKFLFPIRNVATVRVPVPCGQVAEVAGIVDALGRVRKKA